MPKEFARHHRVAQLLQRELAVLIQRELPINQYGIVTLTKVTMSPDLRNAVIYITVMNGGNSNAELEVITELNEKAGQFRHELASVMSSKRLPTLRFEYDESVMRIQRINDLVDSLG